MGQSVAWMTKTRCQLLNTKRLSKYQGMLRGQLSIHLPSKHPTMGLSNKGIKSGRPFGRKGPLNELSFLDIPQR